MSRRLPPHPNLEQLRKQAKDLLDQFRSGDAAALAEVNRFERTPGEFSLTDAQRVLARAYGYESWPKLKAFVDGANVARLAAAVQAGDLTQARSLLRVRPELVRMDLSAGNEHRALHYSVLRRDAAMVRLLMEAGADARQGIFPHRDATSAFVLARDRGYQEIVESIVEAEQRRNGPDAISGSDQGLTPLHVSAQELDLETIERLLSHGANVDQADAKGFTPLDRAALAADPRNDAAEHFPGIAMRLREHGARITIRGAVALNDASEVREQIRANPSYLREIHWMGGGLLSLAVNHGHLEMVRLLLDLGADVDERVMLHELEEPTKSWGTPLWYAALAGRRDIAELLLDRGADPNANVYASGWALRNAQKHEDVKRLLLARGARRQPYMVAEEHDLDEARRLLNAAPQDEELARELAWSAADHGCPAIVELGLEHLPWPAHDPRWHWILVQPMRGIADGSGDHESYFTCMSALLRRGIVNVPNHSGETALHYVAARQGPTGEERARFAAMLIDHGAKLDARDTLLQSTPLAWACRWGRLELAQLLIARGAKIDEPDAEPWATPLAWANTMGHARIVTLLTHGSGGRSASPPGSAAPASSS